MHGFTQACVCSICSRSDGNAIGMGCFSTEQIAWEVMKLPWKMANEPPTGDMIAWDVDVVGEDGMTVLDT